MKPLPNLTEILRDTFRTLIDQFVEFVPRLISAIVILAIGMLFARIVSTVVGRVLDKLGFDKIGDRLNKISVVRQLKTEIKLSRVVAMVLYYFILLVFIKAATEQLGVSAISETVTQIIDFIPRLIAAAIMLQVGVLLADILRGAVVSICQSFNIASGRLLGSIVFTFVLVITIISALGQAGVNTELLESSFNLIIGGVIFAFAVGYGIASRDLMANILSSFYSKNKYREGQQIAIDGVRGEITQIDTLSITLRTGETTTVVPLQLLQNRKVEVFDAPEATETTETTTSQPT